jgi:hypothetical protein
VTPGTKVRTKVDLREPHLYVPAGSVGIVQAIHGPRNPYPARVAFPGIGIYDLVPYRSDELEIIE